MATTKTSPTLSGLSRILSNEPLPELPVFRKVSTERVANEMEQYVRNLHSFLKRLFGKFTATNIITTINEGGGGIGYDKVVNLGFKFKGTNASTTVIADSTFDWRECKIDFNGVAAPTYAGFRSGIANETVGDGFYYPNSVAGLIFSLNASTITFDVSVDAATGNLLVKASNGSTPVSDTAFLQLTLKAYGKIVASADCPQIGNGL